MEAILQERTTTYNAYSIIESVWYLHRSEHPAGKKIISEAIEKDKNNSTLYFHLVDLELHQQPLDKDKVMSVLNKAIHAPLPQEVKEIFSLRKFNWSQAMGIQLDYKIMNELKALHDRSTKYTAYASSHTLRKRPNEYESDIYAKQARLDTSGYSGESSQYQMNYSQGQQNYSQYYSTPTQGNIYQYQSSSQGRDMSNANNQQWTQQYNYQQDWNYQHQY
ncbi:Pre-mRNA-processing factor 39 isoform X2 [Oopsacas minuta]|uniref:Pre-mRNA-processing factor 39 isoform X2 n=1 Tax=Oopsacas minuta TaxID=111878 RepID=A0AAV7JTT1_9METZ|nr:Pre-mRNA-processing factor 39 isoform X2 [Oopsacas minuta]